MRYNCSILDLYDRSIVATLNSDYINTELAKATLEKALMEEKPEKGLILHHGGLSIIVKAGGFVRV